MLSMAPGTNGKGFTVKAPGKDVYRFPCNVFKADKREGGYFLNGGNTGNTQKLIHYRAFQAPALGDIHIYPVPTAIHNNFVVEPGQDFTNILTQVAHLVATNGLALDGNLRGRADKKFHKWVFCRMVYDQESA